MMHRHPHGWIGLGPAALCVALAAGCHGPGFDTFDVFFDTGIGAGFGVSGSETDGCLDPLIEGWPARGTHDVPVSTGLELHFADTVVVSEGILYQGDAGSVATTLESTLLDDRRIVTLLPARHLQPGLTYRAELSLDAADDATLPLCTSSVAWSWHTDDNALGPPETAKGKAWWLPGDTSWSPSGAILGRILSRSADGYGRALAVSLDDDGDTLSVGSVLRDPTLPVDPCDAREQLSLTAEWEALVGTADLIDLGTSTLPLPLRDVRVAAHFDEDGSSLSTFDISGMLDVGAASEAERQTFCTIAADFGRDCHACPHDSTRETCIDLDVRALTADALDSLEPTGTCGTR